MAQASPQTSTQDASHLFLSLGKLPASLGREGGRKEVRDYMVSAILQQFHFLDLSPSMLSINEVWLSSFIKLKILSIIGYIIIL